MAIDWEKWWFSIVDVTSVLIDSDYQTARKCWKVLKGRMIKEGFELVTCYQLKLQAPDGKMRLTEKETALWQMTPAKPLRKRPVCLWFQP